MIVPPFLFVTKTKLFLYIVAPNVPEGYRAQFIIGFVEELVINDDPEYQWIDKIRTPRASNEVKTLPFVRDIYCNEI